MEVEKVYACFEDEILRRVNTVGFNAAQSFQIEISGEVGEYVARTPNALARAYEQQKEGTYRGNRGKRYSLTGIGHVEGATFSVSVIEALR